MSSFSDARLIEAKGMVALEPFLAERADGKLILLEKGPLARVLQESLGDGIIQMPDGRVWSVEIKIEQRDSQNLFLESWSNKNLNDRESHIARGSNPGWMSKLKADLLLYYFIESDSLYILDMFRLKRWAFGCAATGEGRVYRFPEKAQSRREQYNDTWGWCVPKHVLFREVGYKLVHPKQLALFADDGICPPEGRAA